MGFQSRLVAITLVVSLFFTACGGGLTDAQLAWCLDTTTNRTKEVVDYPEGTFGDGLLEGSRRAIAFEFRWRDEHPDQPLPTKIVPDENSSNVWTVWIVASNLDILPDDVGFYEGFVPLRGEAPSSFFVRACKAAYEIR